MQARYAGCLLAALLLSACGGGNDETTTAAGPQRLDVTARDFALKITSSPALRPGPVRITARNSGRERHGMVLVKLNDGVTTPMLVDALTKQPDRVPNLLTYVGEHIVYDLRTALYRHLQRLSLDFYAARRVGEIVSRLSSDVTQMRTMLTTNITSLLSQIVTLIGAIIIVLALNANLTLFILALVPVLLVVAFVFGRRIQKASTGVQDQLADATVVAEEGLQGVRVVKSFGRETYETQRYQSAMEKTFQSALRMAVLACS